MPPCAAPVSPACDHNHSAPVLPLSEAVAPFPPPRTAPLPPPQEWEYLRLGLVSQKVSGLSTPQQRKPGTALCLLRQPDLTAGLWEREDRSLKAPVGPKCHEHPKLWSKGVSRQCSGGFFSCCCKRARSKQGASTAPLLGFCHREAVPQCKQICWALGLKSA